jgi:hypothetical protein
MVWHSNQERFDKGQNEVLVVMLVMRIVYVHQRRTTVVCHRSVSWASACMRRYEAVLT